MQEQGEGVTSGRANFRTIMQIEVVAALYWLIYSHVRRMYNTCNNAHLMCEQRAAQNEAGHQQRAGNDAQRLRAEERRERWRNASGAYIFVLPSLLISRPNISARRQSLSGTIRVTTAS